MEAHPTWGVLFEVQREAWYVGDTIDSLAPLLTTEQGARMKLEKLRVYADGRLVANGTNTESGGDCIYIFKRPGEEPLEIDKAQLAGQTAKTGLREFSPFKVLEPDGFVAGDVYSTDAGESWFYAPPPHAIEGWVRHAYSDDRELYGFDATTLTWFVLNMPSKTWVDAGLPDSTLDLIFLTNGAAVASKVISSQARSLWMRESRFALWKQVTSVTRSDGMTIDLRSPASFQVNTMVRMDDSTVVIPIVGCVAIVTDGHTYKAVSTPPEMFDVFS